VFFPRLKRSQGHKTNCCRGLRYRALLSFRKPGGTVKGPYATSQHYGAVVLHRNTSSWPYQAFLLYPVPRYLRAWKNYPRAWWDKDCACSREGNLPVTQSSRFYFNLPLNKDLPPESSWLRENILCRISFTEITRISEYENEAETCVALRVLYSFLQSVGYVDDGYNLWLEMYVFIKWTSILIPFNC